MSGETEQVEQQTAPVEAPKEVKETGFVDLSDLPEDKREAIEKRIKHLTWTANEAKRGLRELGQQYKQTLGKVEELETWKQQLEGQSAAQRLETLNAAKIDALEKADYRRVAEIDTQLLKESKPKAEPQTKTEPALTSVEQATVQLWANEVGPNGEYKRPWAHPDHEKNQEFVNFVAAVAQEMGNVPIANVLSEVDRRLIQANKAKPNGAAAPQSSVRPNTQTAASLSPDQKKVAVRMFLHSKVAKDEKEAFALYAKSIGAKK